MESNNLMSSQKKVSIFNKNDKNKKILLKTILIFLVLLFISFLYIINLFLCLNKKVSILNKNLELFKIQNKDNKKKIDSKNDKDELNRQNKPANYNKNDNNRIEDYIRFQNDFCNYPDKFYNQEFEQFIKLTNFSFKNVSYQMYVYKKKDNYMSNEIIRSAKYEHSHMSNILEAL